MVRLKHRYLLVDILYPDSSSKTPRSPANVQIHAPTSDALTPGLLAKMVREGVGELYGDWGVGRLGGMGASGVSVKYLSPATSTAIIRCPRASYRLVWSSLTYLSAVPELSNSSAPGKRVPLQRPCVFRVIRVSGTMRKAEEEAIRRARREILRVRGVQEGDILGGLVGGVVEGEDVDVEMGDEDEED